MDLSYASLSGLREKIFPAAPLLSNLLLLALWGWLYHPVYPYLKVIFTREDFRTNQVVLLAVLMLIAIQVRNGDLRLDLRQKPYGNRVALGLVLACSVFFLLSERFLDINTLSASMFGLATYGLLGLWMESSRWRQGLPAAFLLIGALPFGDHMQTFIGYPVRIITAGIVREGLVMLGIHTISVDTILVFENGISQVDLPCSGVKSLWTGGIFLLAATWIEGRSLNLRWFLSALVFAILLLAANLVRVAVLVAVGQAAGWRLMAEMLHVPLGVIGFAAACAAALWMLRRSRCACQEQVGTVQLCEAESEPQNAEGDKRPRSLIPGLAGLLLVMILLYAPRPESATAQAPPIWQFPAGLEVEAWLLTPGEVDWLSSAGVEGAERWRFAWGEHTGSMLLVSSSTWRAHHRPERCFEVYGLDINNSQAYLAAPDFPIRLLTLGKGSEPDLISAVYWFQSLETATDDYAVRIWSDLAPERQRWVLVTILFDGAADPTGAPVVELYKGLHQAVRLALEGAQP
jgi:exosortase O